MLQSNMIESGSTPPLSHRRKLQRYEVRLATLADPLKLTLSSLAPPRNSALAHRQKLSRNQQNPTGANPLWPVTNTYKSTVLIFFFSFPVIIYGYLLDLDTKLQLSLPLDKINIPTDNLSALHISPTMVQAVQESSVTYEELLDLEREFEDADAEISM